MTSAGLLPLVVGALALLLAVPEAQGQCGGRDACLMAVGIGGTYVNLDGARTGAPSAVIQYGTGVDVLTGVLVFELGYRPATEVVHLRLTGEALVFEHAGVLAGVGGVVGAQDPGAEFLVGLVAYLPVPLDKRSAIKLGVTCGGFLRLEAAPSRDGFFVGGRLLFRHLFGDV